MFYGAVVWDPWLIVAQMVGLQCLYYLTLGLLMALLVGTRVSQMSLLYFFDFSTLAAATFTGWCAIASFLLASAAGCLIRNLTEQTLFPTHGDLSAVTFR